MSSNEHSPSVPGSFLEAILNGSVARVRRLIRKGGQDLNKPHDEGVVMTCENGQIIDIEELLPPVVIAAIRSLSMLRLLVNNGADVQCHPSPLTYAIKHGSEGSVEYLLSCGLVQSADALVLATKCGRLDLVTAYCKHGADIHWATEKGMTPLDIAA
jgi:hypothetical protein